MLLWEFWKKTRWYILSSIWRLKWSRWKVKLMRSTGLFLSSSCPDCKIRKAAWTNRLTPDDDIDSRLFTAVGGVCIRFHHILLSLSSTMIIFQQYHLSVPPQKQQSQLLLLSFVLLILLQQNAVIATVFTDNTATSVFPVISATFITTTTATTTTKQVRF